MPYTIKPKINGGFGSFRVLAGDAHEALNIVKGMAERGVEEIEILDDSGAPLKRHPNVHFHFTPTKASWLNQVEIWFSILTAKALTGTTFNNRKELITHINAFIATYNLDAKPFIWTKSEVHQKRLKPCFADQ